MMERESAMRLVFLAKLVLQNHVRRNYRIRVSKVWDELRIGLGYVAVYHDINTLVRVIAIRDLVIAV